MLSGLRGKDVLLVFVESYGRTRAGPAHRRGRRLMPGTSGCISAGFSSRSGWLTSPTFGGVSWLAHVTLQSGLWVDSQQRYDRCHARPAHPDRGFG